LFVQCELVPATMKSQAHHSFVDGIHVESAEEQYLNLLFIKEDKILA